MSGGDLSKELWYHGRVSRPSAEQLLEQRGNLEGSYLVRDSLTTTGEYVLSLCHQVCMCVYICGYVCTCVGMYM